MGNLCTKIEIIKIYKTLCLSDRVIVLFALFDNMATVNTKAMNDLIDWFDGAICVTDIVVSYMPFAIDDEMAFILGKFGLSLSCETLLRTDYFLEFAMRGAASGGLVSFANKLIGRIENYDGCIINLIKSCSDSDPDDNLSKVLVASLKMRPMPRGISWEKCAHVIGEKGLFDVFLVCLPELEQNERIKREIMMGAIRKEQKHFIGLMLKQLCVCGCVVDNISGYEYLDACIDNGSNHLVETILGG